MKDPHYRREFTPATAEDIDGTLAPTSESLALRWLEDHGFVPADLHNWAPAHHEHWERVQHVPVDNGNVMTVTLTLMYDADETEWTAHADWDVELDGLPDEDEYFAGRSPAEALAGLARHIDLKRLLLHPADVVC